MQKNEFPSILIVLESIPNVFPFSSALPPNHSFLSLSSSQLLTDFPSDGEGSRPEMWRQLPAVGGRQREGSRSHHCSRLPAERAGRPAAVRKPGSPGGETTCCSTCFSWRKDYLLLHPKLHPPFISPPFGSRDSPPPHTARESCCMNRKLNI